MHRRQFLKYSAVLAAYSGLPLWSRSAFAASRPLLPIPAILQADARNRLPLVIAQGKSKFSGREATTFGYNGSLLGPALRLTRGKEVNVELFNRLPVSTTVHWHGLEIPGSVDGGPQGVIASGGQRSVTFRVDQPASTCWFHPHLHGQTGQQVAMGLSGLVIIDDALNGKLRLPAQWGIDDIPLIIQDKRFNAKGEIDYQLDMMTAAVGWFGDTLLCNGVEFPQLANPRGWLRLRLLNGCNARSLKVAASDGRPLYVIASDGGFLPEPVKLTELEILMGERFEILVETHDGRAFDLLTLPVKQMGMTVAPFDQPVPIVHIQPLAIPASGDMVEQLATLPAVTVPEAVPERKLQLMMNPELDKRGMQLLMEKYGPSAMGGMSHHTMAHGTSMAGMDTSQMGQGMSMAGMDAHHMAPGASMPGMSTHTQAQSGEEHSASHQAHGGHGGSSAPFDLASANSINGLPFAMDTPRFAVPKGRVEKWVISGVGDMMLHPFHIHGTQFRILRENGLPVERHRQGFKDTVKVEGGVSEVLVHFNHEASQDHPYMAHCHLLEHEDTGMMLGFTVS